MTVRGRSRPKMPIAGYAVSAVLFRRAFVLTAIITYLDASRSQE
jgi:hypothetical protein